MNIARMGRTTSTVETRRQRQTPKKINPFEVALRTGAQVLLTGAQIAGGAVGAPMLSAAVNTAVAGPLGYSPRPLTGGNPQTTGAGGGTTGVPGAPGAPAAATDANKTNEDVLRELQEQRMGDDLKLLAIQDKIQQHNRQISLVSNVMRAKHETAKSAISNIRA
ncbi:MAG: hypothetical protein JRH20_11615 [Deltaproteobacteria bacterium]|nr:hypothetical protein [Deltaproteobacteria bacterium]